MLRTSIGGTTFFLICKKDASAAGADLWEFSIIVVENCKRRSKGCDGKKLKAKQNSLVVRNSQGNGISRKLNYDDPKRRSFHISRLTKNLKDFLGSYLTD